MTKPKLQFSKATIPPIHCLGLGVFDGIHLGHQQLLKHADALLTFEPHPISVLKNIKVNRLTTAEELPYYVPQLFTLEFNQNTATMSANQFLDDIILKQINPKKIVVGYDYHYGHNREGNIETLIAWGIKNSIEIIEIEPFTYKEQLVKSRVIRTALTEKNFNQGIKWLGHSYLMKGTVIKGEGRGHQIGIPTANIKVAPLKCIPQYGVYKGKANYNNKLFNAMIYIGDKPTFNSNYTSIEVHILDFNNMIYNESIDIFIEEKIRDDIKFKSKDDLIKQIHQDIKHCYDT